MPESEPKPRLIELVAPGAGQGWKAVLKNGKPAVIHEIPAPAAEAAAAVPRIQRLADHRHPTLAPVLAWGTDPNGIWVAVEPNEGVPLGTILSRGPLSPPAAAALGAAVLSGVAALHEAGIAMGGSGAAAIRVTGNGEVRLSGHPAAAVRGAPSQSDLRARAAEHPTGTGGDDALDGERCDGPGRRPRPGSAARDGLRPARTGSRDRFASRARVEGGRTRDAGDHAFPAQGDLPARGGSGAATAARPGALGRTGPGFAVATSSIYIRPAPARPDSHQGARVV